MSAALQRIIRLATKQKLHEYLVGLPIKELRELVPDLKSRIPEGLSQRDFAFELQKIAFRLGYMDDLQEALLRKHPEDRARIGDIFKMASRQKQASAVTILVGRFSPADLSRLWDLYLKDPMRQDSLQAMAVETVKRLEGNPTKIKAFMDAVGMDAPRIARLPEMQELRQTLLQPRSAPTPTSAPALSQAKQGKIQELLLTLFGSGKEIEALITQHMNVVVPPLPSSALASTKAMAQWLSVHPDQVAPFKAALLARFPRRLRDITLGFA